MAEVLAQALMEVLGLRGEGVEPGRQLEKYITLVNRTGCLPPKVQYGI